MTSSSSSSPEVTAATGSNIQDRFSYKHATHDEVLEDLSSRFILNLPDEELASLERICFQVEQAHWFYEDFIREENPKFPSLPLKKFSAMLFHACPLLHHWSHDHEQAFNTFMQYKTRVPVCGAIMLNDTWEKCVLVKGWKSSSGWGFPKGKINEDEPPASCAIREVLEETGYNLAGQIDPQNVIEMSIKEQKISLFIVPGVPEDYEFKTKTRKEISKIAWFRLTDLPTWRRNKTASGRFYLISPFIGALKAFLHDHKPRTSSRKTTRPRKSSPAPNFLSGSITHEGFHESSSQSSSAENGEPYTPSPHYSEPFTNHVSPVVDNEKIKAETSPGGMDPHFARLLSSLTMSASVLSDELSKKNPSISPSILVDPSMDKKQIISKSPGTPSLPVPGGVRPPATPILASPETNSLTPRMPTPANQSTPTQYHDKIHHLPSPQSSKNTRHDSLSITPPDASLFKPPSTSTAITPSGRTPHQATNALDLSPYLQRPVENPASTKVLRQLALLEAVADESARMSPIYVPTSRNLSAAKQDTIPFHSPLSAPSQPIISYDGSDSRLAGHVSSVSTHTISPLFTGNPTPGYFQTRSKTSHTHHRNFVNGSSGSISMNQGQLLSLMNGSRLVSQTPQLHQQPSHLQRGQIPSFSTFAPRVQHWPSQNMTHPLHTPPFVSHMNQTAHIGSLPTPRIAPSSKDSYPPSGSLLSILNDSRGGHGIPHRPVMSSQIFNNNYTPQL